MGSWGQTQINLVFCDKHNCFGLSALCIQQTPTGFSLPGCEQAPYTIAMDYRSTNQNNFRLSSLSGMDLNIEDPRIVSSRVRVARNLSGFPMPAVISLEDREKVLSTIVSALDPVIQSSGGQFYRVAHLSDAERRDWEQRHILFTECDRFPEISGINRHWPQGAGSDCET